MNFVLANENGLQFHVFEKHRLGFNTSLEKPQSPITSKPL